MTTTLNAATSAGGGLIQSADSSGILALQTAGTTAVTIDASQNVGVGTSSPSVKLHASTSGSGIQEVEWLNNAQAVGADVGSALVFTGTSSNNGLARISGAFSGATTADGGYMAFSTRAVTSGAFTERMRIDASGNLGLGVTPSAWNSLFKAIDVGSSASFVGTASGGGANVFNNAYWNGSNYIYKTTDYATRYLQSSGTHNWYTAASGTAGNTISFTQAMTLDASGNLGVGGTLALGKVYSQTSAAGYAFYGYGNFTSGAEGGIYTGASYLGLNVVSNHALTFATNNTERARIDSSGNLLVGKTTAADGTVGAVVQPTGRLAGALAQSTSGFDTLTVYSTTAAAYRFYVTMDGKVNCTSTTIAGISDVRFKENIRDLDAGLSSIMALKPRKFDWKEGVGKNIKNDRGFIAQEFETVFPDLIGEWKDKPPEGEEPYKTVSADLIPVLVKAIQEQQAIITTLTERITALEA